MKKVGITGGIGSGKSTVCDIFRVLNIPIYSSDQRAKILMVSDAELVNQIKNTFGINAYIQGQLNSAFLADTVFSDSKKLSQLNGLVHPKVAADFKEWCSQQQSKYILKEAAILIESGGYKELDYVVNVVAPIDIRKARIRKRDPQRSDLEIDNIFAKQISDEQRQMHCTHQILNDDSQFLTSQVLALHEFFSS